MPVDLDPWLDEFYQRAARPTPAPATPDALRDDLPADEWMKRRNAQVRPAPLSAAEPERSDAPLSAAERSVAERLAQKIFALAAAGGGKRAA